MAEMTTAEKTERLEALASIMDSVASLRTEGVLDPGTARNVVETCLNRISNILEN